MNFEEVQILINQADSENKKSNFAVVQKLCEEVLTVLQTIDAGADKEFLSLRCRALHQLTSSHRRSGKPEEALATAEEEFIVAKESDNEPDIALANMDLGAAYHYLNEFTHSLEFYTDALALYEKLNEKSGIATVIYYIGLTYSKIGNSLLALEYFDKANTIYEAIGDTTEITRLNGDMGIVSSRIGAFSKALEFYIKALAGYEVLGDRRMAGGTRVNIGQIYAGLGSFETALEYFNTALVEFDEIGERTFKAAATTSIGGVYSGLGLHDKALEYYGNAYSQYEELNNKLGVAAVTISIGDLYREIGSFDKALEFNGKALKICEEIGDRANTAYSMGNIGIVYANKQFDGYDAAKSEEILLKTLAICEEIGDKQVEFEFLKYLAELYEQEERWKDFAINLKKYHLLKDEVQSEEAKKTANLIEQQKQNAEHEKEIAIAKAKADAEMSVTTTLLHKVLPSSIAARLIKGEKIADYFSQVSILFADIVGFTPIASKMPARKVLGFLNYVFGEFDRIIEKYGCEKIKTIGDGYMAVAGAPITCEDHAERVARAACEMMGDIKLPDDIRTSLPKGAIFNIRIGINIGPAFGGIVGENRFVYDIYSDAVNTAARMESHGEPGRIHVSEEFAFHLQNRMDMTNDDLGGITFEEREEIEIKGKGMMKTYFLEKKA